MIADAVPVLAAAATPAPAPPATPTAPADGALELSLARARAARDARDRTAASVLDTATALTGAAFALLYDVDERGVMVPRMALGSRELTTPADAIARRIVLLEPIDPYAVRRAHDAQRRALWAGDLGGEEELRRSMAGRHLSALGLGAPAHVYLWKHELIERGIGLYPALAGPGFGPADAQVLAGLRPLMEEALLAEHGDHHKPAPLPDGTLTEREREVATLVASGRSNATIADRLGMREATVKTHLTHVYVKLGVRNRTELAARYGPA